MTQLLERLKALRQSLRHQNINAFLVPHSDAYQNEYVPPSAERLAFITGFTGSAGIALISAQHAVLFTDGRYTLQAQEQARHFTIKRIEKHYYYQFKDYVHAGNILAYDPWLHSHTAIEQLTKFTRHCGVILQTVEPNPIDRIWTSRPRQTKETLQHIETRFCGASPAEKIAELRHRLKTYHCDAVIITSPLSVCWLFNIRGTSIPHTPICLARAIVYQDKEADIFVDSSNRLDSPLAAIIKDNAAFIPTLDGLEQKTVLLDPNNCPSWIVSYLRTKAIHIEEAADPCLTLRGRKNTIEIKGMQDAHVYDGIAVTRFLAWLDGQPDGTVDEIRAAQQLETFRQKAPTFRQSSFPTISATGQNAAIIHYFPTQRSNKKLKRKDLYLIDSGGHYQNGTTDVTRTIFISGATDTPTADIKRLYTLVLKCHLCLMYTPFPRNSIGSQIDGLVRQQLWQHGFDYPHGTGHGVGFVLSVHESPPTIAATSQTPLCEDMIFSNEPGLYKKGHYGIRIENVMLTKTVTKTKSSMLCCESLTLVPYDLRLIDTTLLTASETACLKRYYQDIERKIMPALNADERVWLKRQLALFLS